MNLSYSILWIEDNQEFIESLNTDDVFGHVQKHGFDLTIEYRTEPEQIKEPVDGSKYDLLVIDYNIAEEDLHGSDVIKQVRSGDCLTEVIFYSTDSTSKLRNLAAKEELEGVFFSSREQEQLLPKIKNVFDLTVRKVIDTDNMRGIVMAGVADLDHLIADVIRGVHNSLDEGKQVDLCRRLLEKMRPVVKGLKGLVKDANHTSFADVDNLLDVIARLDPADFEQLIASRHFDSHKRVEIATSLCKSHEQLRKFKTDFEAIKELLKWRNALAHQRGIFKDVPHLFFEVDGKHEPFDSNRTLLLRQALRSQRLKLLDALKSIPTT